MQSEFVRVRQTDLPISRLIEDAGEVLVGGIYSVNLDDTFRLF